MFYYRCSISKVLFTNLPIYFFSILMLDCFSSWFMHWFSSSIHYLIISIFWRINSLIFNWKVSFWCCHCSSVAIDRILSNVVWILICCKIIFISFSFHCLFNWSCLPRISNIRKLGLKASFFHFITEMHFIYIIIIY